MKRKIFNLALVLCVIICCFSSFTSNAIAPEASVESEYAVDESCVLATRFLNMLNHNYAYGEDFYSVEALVNSAMPELMSFRSAENTNFVAESFVNDYMKDMYGISDIDYASVNTEFPKCEGFVYIIPRGFSVYRHEMISFVQNEDGTYAVTTSVTVELHDGGEETLKAQSVFVENESSKFGFNILSSNIITGALEA